jgi:hypothetical protein
VARATGNGSAWGSLIAGTASVATLPVAVYATRFSDRYDLLHAAFAIPVGAALGVLALALAARAGRRSALSLGRGGRERVARAGRLLGILGLGLAAAGIVSVVVYGLLEYAGTR